MVARVRIKTPTARDTSRSWAPQIFRLKARANRIESRFDGLSNRPLSVFGCRKRRPRAHRSSRTATPSIAPEISGRLRLPHALPLRPTAPRRGFFGEAELAAAFDIVDANVGERAGLLERNHAALAQLSSIARKLTTRSCKVGAASKSSLNIMRLRALIRLWMARTCVSTGDGLRCRYAPLSSRECLASSHDLGAQKRERIERGRLRSKSGIIPQKFLVGATKTRMPAPFELEAIFQRPQAAFLYCL